MLLVSDEMALEAVECSSEPFTFLEPVLERCRGRISDLAEEEDDR